MNKITRLRIESFNKITEADKVLLLNLQSLIEKKERLTKYVLDNLNDYNKLIEGAQELSLFNRLDLIRGAKKQLLDHASVPTLTYIIKGTPFDAEYRYSDEDYVIPKDWLPSLGSYDKYNAKHPKMEIYKALGATITL